MSFGSLGITATKCVRRLPRSTTAAAHESSLGDDRRTAPAASNFNPSPFAAPVCFYCGSECVLVRIVRGQDSHEVLPRVACGLCHVARTRFRDPHETRGNPHSQEDKLPNRRRDPPRSPIKGGVGSPKMQKEPLHRHASFCTLTNSKTKRTSRMQD